jgi:hypothetical protein
LVLCVGQAIPEPSALTMLATALGAGFDIGQARQRRD